jgi:hypothetical protein
MHAFILAYIPYFVRKKAFWYRVRVLYEIWCSHGGEMSMLVFWVVTPRGLVGRQTTNVSGDYCASISSISALKMEEDVPQKRWYLPTSPHGATIQNTNVGACVCVFTYLYVWQPRSNRPTNFRTKGWTLRNFVWTSYRSYLTSFKSILGLLIITKLRLGELLRKIIAASCRILMFCRCVVRDIRKICNLI